MICRHRESNELRETKIFEGNAAHLARSFGRKAVAPRSALKSPGKFNRGCKMRFEAHSQQTHRANERVTAWNFHGPWSETMLVKV